MLFSLIFLLGVAASEKNTIDHERIRQSVRQAITFLKNHQQKNGAIILDGNDWFNVWETVNATLAIATWQNPKDSLKDPIIQAALIFLKDSETLDGMVLHYSDHNNSYCVEASSEYVRLLSLLEKRNTVSYMEVLPKAIFLIKKQLNSGPWKIINNYVSEDLQLFPSVTGFVLRALAAAEMSPLYPDQALGYLKDSQNEEGHWGIDWQYYGTPYYAMDPILKILQLYNKEGLYDKAISKARDYLFSRQRKDGSFLHAPEKYGSGPSAELQTVLALKSLLSCNIGVDHVRVQKGIRWLLGRQRKNGSWNGGMFPVPDPRIRRKEDVYCTAQALTLFHKYIGLLDQKQG